MLPRLILTSLLDDEHSQFLTPSFALSGISNTPATPPAYSSLSSAELDAFLSEMEGDIRAADRDLREIDALEQRGVTGAGKLVGEWLSATLDTRG